MNENKAIVLTKSSYLINNDGGGGGGGAFSSRTRILGECSTIQSPPALFFKVEISSRSLIPLCTPGSVRVFPDELRVSSFTDRFPHYACTAA